MLCWGELGRVCDDGGGTRICIQTRSFSHTQTFAFRIYRAIRKAWSVVFQTLSRQMSEYKAAAAAAAVATSVSPKCCQAPSAAISSLHAFILCGISRFFLRYHSYLWIYSFSFFSATLKELLALQLSCRTQLWSIMALRRVCCARLACSGENDNRLLWRHWR